MLVEHPFLEDTQHIAWSRLTPERARTDIRLGMEQAKAELEAICQVTEPTFGNTFEALAEAGAAFERGWRRLGHLQSVMDSPEIRAVLDELLPEVAEFYNDVAFSPRLYAVLRKAAEQPWMQDLSPVQQRYVRECLTVFRDGGAALAGAARARFAEISQEIAQAGKKYGENVLDATNDWEYVTADVSELEGLPESARETARQDAQDKGYGTDEEPKWRFTLQAVSLDPVLEYAENAALRERVWRASDICGPGKYDNAPLVRQILRLREEGAALLGYGSYADSVTAHCMVGSGAAALEFIHSLHAKVKPAYLAEQETLRKFAGEQSGCQISEIKPWDYSYWRRKHRKAIYDFDEESLRPYFGKESVLQGMFSIYAGLYGIRFTEIPTVCLKEGESPAPGQVEVWHPDVQFYEVHDTETKELLGAFYMDLHPRENKQGGGWMIGLSIGLPPVKGQPRIPHLASICANLSKPVGGKPALLTHWEVQVIFHEFGHLLHDILSEVEVRMLAGTLVVRDFVELPSQINENWGWESEALDRFARHWETGEPIPAELKQNMLAARNYGAASSFMGQLRIGKIDLELHTHTSDYLDRDIEELDEELLADYRVPATERSLSMLRTLAHIFSGGYAAGYYSYKWAEVLAADAFSRFKSEGIFNPETGRDFRRCILSKGNSKPAAELFRDFMGRDPDSTALLRSWGLC